MATLESEKEVRLDHAQDARQTQAAASRAAESDIGQERRAASVAALEEANLQLLSELHRTRRDLENLRLAHRDVPTEAPFPGKATALEEENIELLRELHRMQRALESRMLTDGTRPSLPPHPLQSITATSVFTSLVILVLSKLKPFVPHRLLARARPLREWLIRQL